MDEEIRTILAGNIRAERTRQQLTLDELSEMTGITRESINRYEHNRVMPNAITLYRLAKALNTGTDKLLGIK